MKKKSGKSTRSPFASDYAPYGTYSGDAGSREQWRDAFKRRFTAQEIVEYLGDRSPWAVLGVAAGASAAEVKAAYRRMAKATHPDLNPGIDRAEFQRVLAAYQQLTQ